MAPTTTIETVTITRPLKVRRDACARNVGLSGCNSHHHTKLLVLSAGNCIHLRCDRDHTDDPGAHVDGLADGGQLAPGAVRALHRGGLRAAAALQHSGPGWLLSQPRRRYATVPRLKALQQLQIVTFIIVCICFRLFLFCIAYIKATAALCILTLVTDGLATFLTGLGLRTQDHNLKYKFYRIAVLVMMVARTFRVTFSVRLDAIEPSFIVYIHSPHSDCFTGCLDPVSSLFCCRIESR